MRILVTGATGFVGRYVVPAIAQRGHGVRALIHTVPRISDVALNLPSTAPGSAGGSSAVEYAQADLLHPETLPSAVLSIDAVVHLAISFTPNRETQLTETIESTKNLCEAMVAAGVTQIVHCSSRAVYDLPAAKKKPDETAPIDSAPQFRDDYAKAKIAQEELIQQFAARHNWTVTILRPGFIWGAGREQLAGWGYSVGPLHLVVGSRRQLPMTYVENFAECVAVAVDQPMAAGQVFNIVDDDLPTAHQFAETIMNLAGRGGTFINLPYWPGFVFAKFATGVNRTLLGSWIKLPGLLVPENYQARFHPLHFSNRKAKELLGWQPRFSFREAWERSRGTGGAP